MTPTIVLVHGAFAESSSWDPVIDLLSAEHRVVAAPNPLRSVATDAKAVSDVVRTIDGPVLLVAHSYGGAVMTNVAADSGEITGLVYINGFAPDAGENAFGLAAKFPGSMVGEETVRPVPRSNGTTDLYIAPESFHDVFCADVPRAQATRMAITQRPATQEALVEPSGDPLWKHVPSWFLIGEQDRIIPAQLQRFMAERAGEERVVELPTASHAAAVSHPESTVSLILEAATTLSHA
jgi:pimeloyl-ACP methyl ester carboxylesterase